MNICIFEDFFIPRLAPLNHLRHTSELISGLLTLQEKILNHIPGKVNLTLHSRKYIADYCREKFPKAGVNDLSAGEYIYLNSRVLFNEANLKEIVKTFKKEKNSALTCGKDVIAFHTTAYKTAQFREIVNGESDNLISYGDIEWLGLNKIETKNYKLINYPSDLILYNDEEISFDLKRLLNGKNKLRVSNKAEVSKNVVFDTSNGSIYIEKNTVIEPFTYIQGPVYIGENCTVRSGAKLYGPVRIGDWCKISGEITHSILHSYVNKQHLGFLGHSYLAEWVNLGAGTTTSNLKNNYSPVTLEINGEKIDTNSIFLGSIIGDHTKTGIHTMLNTGTLIGVSSNLYGAGYHRKLVKSFSWEDAATGKNITYEPEKAINTAKASMKRRDIEMTSTYEALLRYLFSKKDEISL